MRAPRAGTRSRARRSSTLVCSPAPGLRWSGHTGRSAASPVAHPAVSPAAPLDPRATRARNSRSPAPRARTARDPRATRARNSRVQRTHHYGGAGEEEEARTTCF